MPLQAFEPVIDSDSRILILGSMPGEQSLRKQQYYGNRRNAFWNILYSVFQEEVQTDYTARKAFLLRHRIALWDVLEFCEREGSLDSNIRNPVSNDFTGLFVKYPAIRKVCFNGQTAQKLFKRLVLAKLPALDLEFYTLPSTSPANAAPYEEKRRQWQQVLLEIPESGT